MKAKIGIYPGAFDPLTFGHLDIIKRSLKIVDKLIIGVADNINKKSLLSIDDRKKLILSDIKTYLETKKDILVDNVSGLLTAYAKKNNVDYYTIEPQKHKIIKRSYSDNFLKDK